MRIVQINSFVNSRSHGRIAEDIGKVIIDNGHESYIAFGRGNFESKSKLIKIGSQKDVYKHGLKTRLFDKHGLGSKKATLELIKQLENLKPDAIGLHNIHGYYINYKVLFKYIKANNIPVLWTLHDCWSFTGHCAYFTAVNCQKWKSQCHKCPLISKYPKAITDRSYLNFKDKKEAFQGVKDLKLITPSQWLANLVKDSFLKSYTCEVLHNGIDLSVFRPMPKFRSNEKIILGVASIWDFRKGLSDFILLRKLLPESYKIVLVGLSSNQIFSLPPGITGIKRTESIEELVKWYNKASVFVNPTYIDNFPTTNIEALACGTPVVTYDTGGCAESIDHHTGIAVQKSDIDQLVKAIKQILSQDDITIQNNCINRARKLYNKNDVYYNYFKNYQTMVGSKINRIN
jgi:glycosyltransferase involved in cell wall biosynthesis